MKCCMNCLHGKLGSNEVYSCQYRNGTLVGGTYTCEAWEGCKDGLGMLHDFACAISDMVWGGELGWCKPTPEEGLKELEKQVRGKLKLLDSFKKQLADKIKARIPVPADPPPRYDEVYFNGLAELERNEVADPCDGCDHSAEQDDPHCQPAPCQNSTLPYLRGHTCLSCQSWVEVVQDCSKGIRPCGPDVGCNHWTEKKDICDNCIYWDSFENCRVEMDPTPYKSGCVFFSSPSMPSKRKCETCRFIVSDEKGYFCKRHETFVGPNGICKSWGEASTKSSRSV